MVEASLLAGFLSVAIAGLALLLLAVALAAWRRVGGAKLLALAAAFAVFLGKGLWFAWGTFAQGSAAPPDAALLAPDFAVLLLLYVATVR